MSIVADPLWCPICQLSALQWQYGMVFHQRWVHVRLRNQPAECKGVQELATIIERKTNGQATARADRAGDLG